MLNGVRQSNAIFSRKRRKARVRFSACDARLFGVAGQAGWTVVQAHRSLDLIASLSSGPAGPVTFFATLLQ